MQLPSYSITIGYWGQMLSQQAIKDLLDLSGGHPERIALRYQAPMAKVKANWGIYDTAVNMCNDAGIPIYLECKRFDHGVTGPAPLAEMSSFAVAVATRYKGKLAAVGIGNEDYGYKDFRLLANTMVDVYPKIRAVDPDVLILPGCTLQRNERDMRAAVGELLSIAGKALSGLTFHTYYGIPSTGPHVPQDGSVPNVPSFPQCVGILRDVCKQQGYPDMELHDTEFGFACTSQNHSNVPIFSQTDQWKHMQYCLEQARLLGVRHMSWFTLGYGKPPDGMSLRQPSGPTVAFNGFKGYIAQYPTLGSGTPDPTPDPVPDPTPTPEPDPGPTPEEIAAALLHLDNAEQEIKLARALLS